MKAFLAGQAIIITVARLFRKRSPLVTTGLWPCLLLSSVFLFSHQVFADSYFDFDEINAPKKKNAHSAAIDAYMERVYGSEITVGPRAQVVGPRAPKNHARATAASSPPSDSYLINGKGKSSAITLSFDA